VAKILLRIDDELKNKLEELANKNKRSVNSELLVAIDKYVNNNLIIKGK